MVNTFDNPARMARKARKKTAILDRFYRNAQEAIDKQILDFCDKRKPWEWQGQCSAPQQFVLKKAPEHQNPGPIKIYYLDEGST